MTLPFWELSYPVTIRQLPILDNLTPTASQPTTHGFLWTTSSRHCCHCRPSLLQIDCQQPSPCTISAYPTYKIIPTQSEKVATQPPTPPTLNSMSDKNFINRILLNLNAAWLSILLTCYSLYISLFCSCVCHDFNKESLLLLLLKMESSSAEVDVPPL